MNPIEPRFKKKPVHGMSKAKGCNHLQLGTFCRMFPDLPTWADDYGISDKYEAEQVAALLGGVNGIMHDSGSASGNSEIPAAYTFFAQFIDHDITLDTTSALHGGETSHELSMRGCPMHKGKKKASEPKEYLPNLRSASLDLDCVYGFGPEANPHLYDSSQAGRLLVGSANNPNDVPRNSDGTALIGDPRNDENIFVSQMQLLFLKFHNRRLVGRNFEEAQRDVRYHYQYLVWNDFLQKVCDEEVFKQANKYLKKGKMAFDIVDDLGNLCMPVEFSVAAYRFGHTMVRSLYPVNANYPAIELFDERFGTLGFSGLPEELNVDWRFLLDVEKCQDYVKSKAIDHLLADELIRMPDPIVGRFAPENDRSLAFRNLLRSYVLRLPSGQRVAKMLKDNGYPVNEVDASEIEKHLAALGSENEDKIKNMAHNSPLFFYILCESCIHNHGKRLGPVGSAIILEVFGSMLLHCDSYVNQKKEEPSNCGGEAEEWKPDPCLVGEGDFTLSDLVRYVNASVSV